MRYATNIWSHLGLVCNASIILLCLYMRKAYLYNKYRQQAKEFVDNHSGYQISTTGRPFVVHTVCS